MHLGKTHKWISQRDSRKRIFETLRVPITASQVSMMTRLPLGTCSHTLNKLVSRDLCRCLNPTARMGRVFDLTEKGKKCYQRYHKHLRQPNPGLTVPEGIPEMDWDEYGWICFRHKSAVIRTLTIPMQPSEIKRKITQRRPQARISANNVRDVIYALLKRDIVEKISHPKRAHAQYQVTPKGRVYQKLLQQAGSL